MGREELGESSSSQNVNIAVTGIERGAGGKDECLLSDGSSFFIPRGFAAKHGLFPGQIFSFPRIEEIQRYALFVLAKKKALDLLSYREHSRMQLKRKLLIKEFPEDIIRKVLDSLEDEGSLDEERFCRIWIRTRLRRHSEWGRVLVTGLTKAGVGMRLAEKIVQEELADEDEYSLMCRAAAKIQRHNGITKEKIIKKLLSKGFSYNLVLNYSNNID